MAERDKVQPPPSDKLLVLGGNGVVGSHICKEALKQGLCVSSRSRPSVRESWADEVVWHKGNLLVPDSLKDAMNGITAVISCVGGFGSNSYMDGINGTANINAIRAASEQGVKRFVYISGADFGLADYLVRGYYEGKPRVRRYVHISAADFGDVNYVLQGYYGGKKATEAELLSKFPYGGVSLRPGILYGTRHIGGMKIPLGVIASPFEMVLRRAKLLSKIPLVGPLLIPPVNVTTIAKVAVSFSSRHC